MDRLLEDLQRRRLEVERLVEYGELPASTLDVYREAERYLVAARSGSTETVLSTDPITDRSDRHELTIR